MALPDPTEEDPAAEAPAGGDAAPAREARSESRVRVSWPARVQWPGTTLLDLRVRDISERGVGLQSPVALPAPAVLAFAMGIPGLDDPKRLTPVSGRIRTQYVVLKGDQFLLGASWDLLPDEGRALVGQWLRRLRR